MCLLCFESGPLFYCTINSGDKSNKTLQTDYRMIVLYCLTAKTNLHTASKISGKKNKQTKKHPQCSSAAGPCKWHQCVGE